MKQAWLLISDARDLVLRWWNPPVILLLLLVSLQSAFGKYIGHELSIAWFWLLAQLLPGSILLYGSTWLQKFPHKLVGQRSVVALQKTVVLHTGAALITLLLIPLVESNISPGQFLLRSFFWMILTNGLVISSLYFNLFKKETRIRPNAAMIMEAAKQESAKSKNQENPNRMLCLELIAENKLEELFPLMKSFFSDNTSSVDNFNHLIMLQGRYSHVVRQISLGIVEEQFAQIETNRITEALLNLTKLVH